MENEDKNTSHIIPLKQRVPKEKQEFTRNYNRSDIPLYSIHILDWKLFMWFASLKEVKHYIYLFIVIWDAIPADQELENEFTEETSRMIRVTKELKRTDDTKILDDYKNYRYHDDQTRQIFVNNTWAELEKCGLERYSHAVEAQLKCCTLPQKWELRSMVLSRMDSFKSLFVQLTKENEKLTKTVEHYIEENSNQQAALGNLTNLSWNDDDDQNNTKNLVSDIIDLQDALSDFTMVQGTDYKVTDETVTNLLKDYGCQIDYPDKRKKLTVLGYILKRHAITTIFEAAQEYLSNRSSEENDQNMIIESDIVNTTEALIKHTESFRDTREGRDEITKITPVKIRQHVYSALSCRGLSNEHPLVKNTAYKLLNEMNKYRQVVDEETNNELNDLAIQITHKVINIFCFRLKTQEVEPTHRFFEPGDEVNARLMEGAFRSDDIKKLKVEACAFPCIGIFGSDKSDQKVFTKAQVITMPK